MNNSPHVLSNILLYIAVVELTPEKMVYLWANFIKVIVAETSIQMGERARKSYAWFCLGA